MVNKINVTEMETDSDTPIAINKVGASDGKWQLFGLIRDKNGKPKIDDPANLPEQIKNMLTDAEYEDIYKVKRT